MTDTRSHWRADLDIIPHNPLKHWEFKNVFQVHHHLLSHVADQRFMAVQAVNVSTDRVDAATKQQFGCFADKVIATLSRHEPWVLKDPRMMHFADLWLHRVRCHSMFVACRSSCVSQKSSCST